MQSTPSKGSQYCEFFFYESLDQVHLSNLLKGKSKTPAVVTSRTKTYDEAKPNVPSNLKHLNLINGDMNVTWDFDSQTDFKPDNFTLLVSF